MQNSLLITWDLILRVGEKSCFKTNCNRVEFRSLIIANGDCTFSTANHTAAPFLPIIISLHLNFLYDHCHLTAENSRLWKLKKVVCRKCGERWRKWQDGTMEIIYVLSTHKTKPHFFHHHDISFHFFFSLFVIISSPFPYLFVIISN
jgi:hypothetical protein